MGKSFAYPDSPLRESELGYTAMVSLTISAIHLRCTSILYTYFTAILRPGFFAVVKVIAEWRLGVHSPVKYGLVFGVTLSVTMTFAQLP